MVTSPMEKPGHASPVEVRTSPFHGRGLFAAISFDTGDRIAIYPLLILDHEDSAAIRNTLIGHYVFHIDEDPDGRARTAVAFGPISMCNHSPDANADFQIDVETQSISLTARKPIARDAEILIDYEDYASEII